MNRVQLHDGTVLIIRFDEEKARAIDKEHSDLPPGVVRPRINVRSVAEYMNRCLTVEIVREVVTHFATCPKVGDLKRKEKPNAEPDTAA